MRVTRNAIEARVVLMRSAPNILIGPDRAPFGPNAGQFYLRQPTERGLIVNCQFEFKLYTFVRDGDVPSVDKARAYFKARGAICGGN